MAVGNKEEKKNGARSRLNLLDIVLVLLLILCVVGVWQRKNLQKLFSDEEVLENYTITFEVKQLRSSTVELLQKDTAFYLVDGDSIVSMGVLAEQVSTAAATAYFEDEDGTVVSAVYPQDQYEYLLDVTGALSCRGIRRDDAFLLNGKKHLSVNESVLAHTENADIEIYITSITKTA